MDEALAFISGVMVVLMTLVVLFRLYEFLVVLYG